MKIAFASKDGICINEHFGWCEKFFLYEITKEGVCSLGVSDASIKYEEEADKLAYKIERLEESHVVCVTQIGPKAANLLQSVGIYPLKVASEDETIEQVSQRLFNYMNDDSSPLWFKRLVYQHG